MKMDDLEFMCNHMDEFHKHIFVLKKQDAKNNNNNNTQECLIMWFKGRQNETILLRDVYLTGKTTEKQGWVITQVNIMFTSWRKLGNCNWGGDRGHFGGVGDVLLFDQSSGHMVVCFLNIL